MGEHGTAIGTDGRATEASTEGHGGVALDHAGLRAVGVAVAERGAALATSPASAPFRPAVHESVASMSTGVPCG